MVLKERLKAMFHEMVIYKQITKIPEYYHQDFLLYTNGTRMDYEAYLKCHEEIYATPIQYEIKYDEETFVEQGEKLACRVFITTKKPGVPPTEIEVVLIADYKEGKIYRLWELTYPDWSQTPAFQQQDNKDR